MPLDPYPPPHDFVSGPMPDDDPLIITPALQMWANDRIIDLEARGKRVPEGLITVRDGQPIVRRTWWWLVDEVLLTSGVFWPPQE